MLWIESEYRLTPTTGAEETPWRTGSRTQAGNTKLTIGRLVLGLTYDVRVRTLDDVSGRTSAWVTRTAITTTRPPTDPPPPDEVRQTTGGCLSWRMPEVPDGAPPIAGYLVRHAPGNHDTWETMEPAHEGVVAGSPWNLCEVPGGQRTLAIKSVDAHGSESSAATFVTVHVRDLDDGAANELDVVELGTQAPAYPGFKRGGTVVGSTIVAQQYSAADTAPAWEDDLEPAWAADATTPAWLSDDTPAWATIFGTHARAWSKDDTVAAWGAPYKWIDYTFVVLVDSAAAGPGSRLTVDVTVTSPNGPWRLEYRRACGSSPAWSENEFDAAWDDDADPAWPTGNERWRMWPGRLEAVAPGEYRFRVLVPGGRKQGIILAVSYRVTAPSREEKFSMFPIPAGGARLPPSSPFRTLNEVRVTPWSTTAPGVRVDIADRNPTKGPLLVATDASGEPAAAVADVVLVGA